jgi:D-inositol-3-phosphate glycosyltransferase
MEALEPHDLIHSHHWMSGVAALPVTRAWGVPHVMTFHSVAAHPNSPLRDGEPPESPARVDGEVVCAEQSDLVLCVSRHEAAVVIGRCGADPERVRIVRPGVNVDLFHPATQPWAPPGIRPGYVVFAARLQPLKAPDVAIRTMACLPDAIRPDLAVVGEASADFAGYEAELHTLVDDLGLRGQVHFLAGQDRESLARIVRHASVMLVPSHSETFGLIALEASASGIPVLAAASGGLTEAICNTHTGLLIPTHDPRTWAEALEALLTDKPRRTLIGATGRNRALAMTWERAAENTLQQYRRIL